MQNPSATMTLEEIRHLDGKTVLVKPARADDPNAVGLRGTIRVYDLPTNQGMLHAEIVLRYPERGDVDGPAAHEENIVLSQIDVIRLIDSDVTGTGAYEFTLAEDRKTVE